jgi:hypothetical protein
VEASHVRVVAETNGVVLSVGSYHVGRDAAVGLKVVEKNDK